MNMITSDSKKPLGHRSYGGIGHLPSSRMDANHAKYGTGKKCGEDFGIHEGQARICTVQPRDRHDRIIVQEKLDGSNVSVARIDGLIVPLIRAGYRADGSRWPQHHLFAKWVYRDLSAWDWLPDGMRACGEWLAQAHGTRYKLTHAPFVVFDLMRGHERLTMDEVNAIMPLWVPRPELLHDGGPCSIETALDRLGEYGYHGAIDPVEGAVWRVERKGEVDFLAKYVRPGKVDGCFLPEITGAEPVWNWQPGTWLERGRSEAGERNG